MSVEVLKASVCSVLERYPWVREVRAQEDERGLLFLVIPDERPSLFQLADLWWDLKGALEPEGVLPRVKLAPPGEEGGVLVYVRNS